MAGGMLTKQADQLTAAKLNSVNDASSGGAIVSLPSGVTGPAVSATIPGDRIVLDDATALALSNTTVGTLYGGVYMYVGTVAGATNAIALGQLAYWRANELPGGAGQGYIVTSDPQPSASVPTFVAGVFINAITKGNYGWIQVAGFASVLFDQSQTGTNAAGNACVAKISPNASTPASVDNSPTSLTVTTLAQLLGVCVSYPIASTVSQIIMTRGLFCGRI